MSERPSLAQRPQRAGEVGPELHVVMHGVQIARLASARNGRVKLTYEPAAQTVTRGLSCCLPADGRAFGGDLVNNWIGGLLPDRSEVLTRWRAEYGLKRDDAYALLWHVGEDVAGAARFVRPERMSVLDEPVDAEPLTDAAIGARIAALSADATAWAPSPSTGQFSLAGAQAKFALARTDNGWVETSGTRPTTHIFKPAIRTMADQDLNEHLTMRLARAVGLRVAPTEVLEFAGARVLVVERFDRYRANGNGTWKRLHQEDMVQAQGMKPSLKYQEHGGPGVREVAAVLRSNVTAAHTARDTAEFIDAIAFNWLTMGTDAHARNYALIHHGPQTRLAPLYDLNSFLPYTRDRSVHLAMRVGFTNRDPRTVGASDWDELARDCRVDPEATVERVRAMAERLIDAAGQVLRDDEAQRWGSDLPERLRTSLVAHARDCARRL